MELGIDLSILNELEELKTKYKYNNKQIEPISFFANHSKIKTLRLRLWIDPFDKDGDPYGGGTNDLDTFLYIAKKAKEHGMDIILDFHYSDFWVDPSRQLPPKSWIGKSFDEVVDLLYKYTKDTLNVIKENDIKLIAIQVGNEISHGIAFPYGEINKEFDPKLGGGFKGLTTLLKAGCQACKEIYPNAKRILHLEHSGSFDMQDWFFSNMKKENVPFEVIGESYYPYWHGPINDFKNCISNLKKKYQKEIWLVELGYPYIDYDEGHDFSEVRDAKEGDFIPGNINGRIPFPLTKQGQAEYISYMLKTCKELGIGLVCYWEPTWIYIPNNGWASDAGQIYCGLTPMPPFNSWKNYTFFDKDGSANPVVDIFTQDYADKI